MSVILLNGCTSAGKSSIARCLQDLLEPPHLLTGIDDAFAAVPQRYHNHPEGFFFDRDDRGLVRLNFGAVAWAALHAHQAAAAAMARSGAHLILDEVILNRQLYSGWQSQLKGVPVLWVGVQCELAELERRELERGDRVIGQARGQFDIVHRDVAYDVEVDSTARSAQQLSEVIAAAAEHCGFR